MVNSEVISGVDSFVQFGKETGIGVEQSTVDQVFGLVKSFNSQMNNNPIYSRGFKGTTTGGRNVASIRNGVRSFDHTVTMAVLNWSFLEYVFGSVSGSSTKTYVEEDVPPSMTLHRCINNPGVAADNEDAIWLGTVVESVTIRCATGQEVEVSLNLKSLKRKDDTTIVTREVLPSTDVFTFVGANIELPSGSSLPNIIDSMELTITNNWKEYPGLGSVHNKTMRPKERDYKVRFTVKYLDSALTNAVKGAADPTDTTEASNYATIVPKFVSGEKSCTFTLNNFKFEDSNNMEENLELATLELNGTAKSGGAEEVV